MLQSLLSLSLSLSSPYPVHDSPSILLTRSGHYHKNVAAVRDWYSEEHDNWSTVDGERNCWHVWRQAHSIALHTTVQIQQYLVRVTEGKREKERNKKKE